jgi:hypothetical protein
MSRSQLHSINESRARLGNIGRDAIYGLLNSGQLNGKKIGRRTFITDESLEKYVHDLPPFPPRSTEIEAASEEQTFLRRVSPDPYMDGKVSMLDDAHGRLPKGPSDNS